MSARLATTATTRTDRCLIATIALVAGCRHLYVPEDPKDEPATSSSSTGTPTACTELLWDHDEPLALDPLYGVQSERAFIEGADGVRLVSARLHPDGTSTLVSTHVADPWGASVTVAAPVDRGSITSGKLRFVPRADGSAMVFSIDNAVFHDHDSVTYRAELPAGDGAASTEHALASTFTLFTFASGRAVLARIETLEEGGSGYPWVQRMVFSDAETDVPLFERDGELFQPYRAESGVGRAAYFELEESEDYDAELPVTFRSWLVFEEGLVDADLTAFWKFGRTAAGSIGVRLNEASEPPVNEVVAFSEEGVPGHVLFALPPEIAEAPGSFRIMPWMNAHAIISQLAEEGEEEAALEVHAQAADGTPLVSPALASRRQADAVQVLLGPDGQSLLVAYEAWPANTGVRLARLVCR